ncbi:MAG: hypothetical protein SFX18_02455 [Pirellulales bacterium]|nr:hypothetical protein [Pirellulales bacterium]
MSPSFKQLLMLVCSACLAYGMQWQPVAAAEVEDIGFNRLEEAAQRIAKHVGKLLTEYNETAVIVGDFTAPPRLKTSGGTGVRQLVINALKSQKIDVRDDAKLQLIGSFANSDQEQRFEGEIGLLVKAQLLDENDRDLDKFNISVFGAAALQITGGTVDLPANANADERREKQNNALKNPAATIVKNEVRAAPGSEFGIEILTKDGADLSSRQPTLTSGRAFVPLHKGEEYIVRLYNRSPHEAAVLVTVDGLSMFSFSSKGNFGSQVIVPPGKHVDVTGWYFDDNDTRAFLLTSYPDSAAGKKGIPTSSIGVITATFAATWKPEDQAPGDETSTRGADTATGIGEKTGQNWVPVKRVIGRPRSVVSVRYNRPGE